MAQHDGSQLRLDVGGQRDGYRGPAVTKIVGITYRQLDYWARTGLVEPSLQKADGSGTQRLYSFDDIVRLKVVKRLLDTGVSLAKVRLAVDELRGRGQSLAETTLVSDGTTVYAVDDDAQVLDLLKRGQGVFGLSLDPLVRELRGEVAAFPTIAVRAADADTAVEPPATGLPVGAVIP